MTAFERQSELKDAIRNGTPVLGLFIKIPAIQIIESLASAGLDFVVLDAEHAAFGSRELDCCILAGRSVGLPILVRLREATSAAILQVLDMGAAGVVVPHITSAEQAEAIISATRYQGGTRGFSGMHRAAGYGTVAADEFKAASDNSTLVIGQIEDAAGLNRIEEIAAVTDIDALLIGSADLTVSLGATGPDDPLVTQAIDTIFAAAQGAGMRSGIFLPTVGKTAEYQGKGASFFVIGTDQGLLVDASSEVARQFHSQKGASDGG